MKSVTCLAALCGTATLHAGVAILAFRLLAPADNQPTPEPVLIQAHLAPRALPIAPPLPAPAPMPAPAVEKPHTPSARPAPRPTPAKPVAKAQASPAAPLSPPLAHAEAAPAPAINSAPAVAVVAPPAPQPALPAPAAPVRAGPSIPASYAASNRKPDYPLIARRYGEQGTVMLSVYVRADGSAGEVLVKTSSGHELLDESAKTAVQGWRFNPASIDGKPIAQWYQIPIPFTLSNSLHN
jgi:periplasmic protein TonB